MQFITKANGENMKSTLQQVPYSCSNEQIGSLYVSATSSFWQSAKGSMFKYKVFGGAHCCREELGVNLKELGRAFEASPL